MSAAQSTQQWIDRLGGAIRRIEAVGESIRAAAISTGSPHLDRLLPHGGFPQGSFVEWMAASAASGAALLALGAARQAAGEEDLIVVIDRAATFYPPAAAALGIRYSQLVVVRPQNARDHHWAIDQSLRCGGAAAVVAWPEKTPINQFRRWQLAAEAGGTLGLFLRPETARAEPSWATARLLVEPLAPSSHDEQVAARRNWRITVLKCRHGSEGQSVELCLDETDLVLKPRTSGDERQAQLAGAGRVVPAVQSADRPRALG
jgi:protein ImuA